MQLNDEVEVIVEKLVNEGKALARYNNETIFINDACPLDQLKIRISKVTKHYLEAEIINIIKPSQYRVKPFCSMYKVCGSCNWQYIEYNEQLNQKRNIVKETIKNIAGIEIDPKNTIPSPKVREYRYKVQYPVSERKSGRIISGYYKNNSHEIVNIKYCPIHNPLINEIMEYIKENACNYKISGYNEKNNTGMLRHVIFKQSSYNNEILIILVINSEKQNINIINFSKVLYDKYKEIIGVCVNYNNKKTNVILGSKTEKIIGQDYYTEELSGIKYKISANSFFQTNPQCGKVIFDTVKCLISAKFTKPTILDAYSGVSSFGIWLNDVAEKITCIEEVKSSVKDAQENIILNNCKNIEIINGDAEKEFSKLVEKSEKFDISIIDPPRKGTNEKTLDNLIKLTDSVIIYVSCNISTLARDMKYLINKGWNVTYVQPVDMFPNTYHVETIVLFENNCK